MLTFFFFLRNCIFHLVRQCVCACSFVTIDNVISSDPVVTLVIDSLFYFSVTFSSKVGLEAI